MNGIAYAIGEILVFLIVATVLGVLIGRVVWPRRQLASQQPTDARVNELETKGLILEGKLEDQATEVAQLKAELLQARSKVALLESGEPGTGS